MTEPQPLPEQGPEKTIFIEALRRMSRDCEAPALLAECPFSVDLPAGGRGCGEECESLLHEHDPAGARQDEAMPGIPGMGFSQRTRPAHRRPAAADDSRAFDAAECYLRERDTADRSLWSPPAVVFELRELLLTPPYGWAPDRLQRLQATASELFRRGLDAELLIRHGFGPLLVTHFAMAAAGVYLGEQVLVHDPDQPEEMIPQEVQDVMTAVGKGWARLLEGAPNAFKETPDEEGQEHDDADIAADLGARIRAALAPEFSRKIWHHVMSAPLESLYAWQAPPTLEIVAPGNVDREVRRHYVWAADRFTETYEGNWHPDSLREEWRYLRGTDEPTPFSKSLLDSRPMAGARIAEMLADATCNEYGQDHISTGALKAEAVRFLRDGRRDAAVAVFEAAQRSDPNNAELVNNYGFCLIPDTPDRAIAAMEDAVKLGFADLPINSASRVLALKLLGRNAAALELAEQLLDAVDAGDEHPDSGYLWEYDDEGELRLGTHRCPRCYVADLALTIARESGDPMLVDRWEKRAET